MFMQLALIDTILWTIQFHSITIALTIDQIIFWGMALVIGVLARLIFGHRVPFGIIGTFLVALFGIWVASDVILINISRELYLYDVPLIKSLASGLFFEIVWYLLSYTSYRSWSRRKAHKAERATDIPS